MTPTWFGDCVALFPIGGLFALGMALTLGLVVGVAVGQALAMRERMPHADPERRWAR